jgi:hypothetical protein
VLAGASQPCEAWPLVVAILGSRHGQVGGTGLARLVLRIGVISRPETELPSHCFQASFPHQFDETRAATPLARAETTGVPTTYPFGL